MLQTQTVEPGTFSILTELNRIQELSNAALVRGTALSLFLGHRISEDLDFFVYDSFDSVKIEGGMKKAFGERILIRTNNPKIGIFGFVDNIKVDVVFHPHVMLKGIKIVDFLRFFSLEDIVAMKVQAILGRGKKKDFWDIAALLEHFSVRDFVEFHRQKYPNQYLLISVPQAMTYFADAEEDQDPISLKGQTWESVKDFIRGKVREYLL